MKYTQVRFETKMMIEAEKMIKHNTRYINPEYVRDCMEHNREKNTIVVFGENGTKEYELQARNKESKEERINRLEVNKVMMKQLKEELEQCKIGSKNFREKKHAVVIDSIVTLSNEINEMYSRGEITKEELNRRFIKTVGNMEKELGLKALNATIHYDEKTPHMHVSYRNYYNGKGISRDLKTVYKKAQDISAYEFADLGFVRGEEKEKTNAKHMKVYEMHQAEIKEIERQQEVLVGKTKEIVEEMERLEKKKTTLVKDQKTLIQNSMKEVETLVERNKKFIGVDIDNLKRDILKWHINRKYEVNELKELKEKVKTFEGYREVTNKQIGELREEQIKYKELLVESKEIINQLSKMEKDYNEYMAINKLLKEKAGITLRQLAENLTKEQLKGEDNNRLMEIFRER